jgi:hypothetical protein
MADFGDDLHSVDAPIAEAELRQLNGIAETMPASVGRPRHRGPVRKMTLGHRVENELRTYVHMPTLSAGESA